MEKDQAELAVDLVGLVETHLGEHYRSINSELNESLFGSDSTPQDAIANKNMLSAIVGQLPRLANSKTETSFIEADNPAQVRWLQSALVWEQAFSSMRAKPAYLLGAQAVGKRVNLLLHGVKGSSENVFGRLFIARGISRREYDKAIDFMQGSRTKTFSETELNRAYRHGKYLVDTVYLPRVALSDYRRVEWRNIRRANSGGVTLWAAGHYEHLSTIGNERLAAYNVMDHIGHLAAGFNVVDKVKRIIAANNTPSGTGE